MYTLTPMFLAVVASWSSPARRCRAASTCKKFKPEFEQFNLVNGHQAGVRHAGALERRQGAAEDRRRRARALYLVVQGLVPVLMTAGGLPVSALLDAAGGGAVVAAAVRGASPASSWPPLDVFVVMRRNRKKTRMTKKEVQDENKNTEGDPLIKSQRRSRQLAMSRNRMIAAVGDCRRRAGQPDARRRRAEVRTGQVRAARGGQGRRH